MLLRVGRAAVLKVGSGELLAVVAEVDSIVRGDLQVNLPQINVLIESARIVVGQRQQPVTAGHRGGIGRVRCGRSEEHTSELQSLRHLVCRLLLEKKKRKQT